MKKIRFGIGGVLMIAAMLVSDSGAVVALYAVAALLHEIGHIVAAKIMKVGIDEVKFGFSGVRIVTDRRLTSYKSEFLLSAAGPAVNLAVFALVTVLFVVGIGGGEVNGLNDNFATSGATVEGNEQKLLIGGGIFNENAAFCELGGAFERILRLAVDFMASPRADIGEVTAFLAVSSLVQAIFNLLPVKSFDGGRMLYCASAHLLGEGGAERIITLTTSASALVLWIVALYLMIKVGGGLGIYVFAACVFASTTVKNEKGV